MNETNSIQRTPKTFVFYVLLNTLTVSSIYASENGQNLILMQSVDVIKHVAPLTPRSTLRAARARNIVAQRLAKPPVHLALYVRKVADQCADNTWCCGLLGGFCIVLCNGCCYQPSAQDIDEARFNFPETRTADSFPLVKP